MFFHLSSYHIVLPYCHAMLSCHIGIPFCHAILSCYIGMPYCHAILSCHIVLPYCPAILSCHIVMPYCHAILSCHIGMTYCHAISVHTKQCNLLSQGHKVTRSQGLSGACSNGITFSTKKIIDKFSVYIIVKEFVLISIEFSSVVPPSEIHLRTSQTSVNELQP